jgi:molybdopterin-containing oxidoreductase family iron-sulfur binding subunit
MGEHEHIPEAEELSRRTFLKLAGFAFTGAVAAGCQRAPVQNALPMAVQAEEVVPGRSLFYASTCGGCTAGCGVLVKNRDGRPIKLEGNQNHPLSLGGLCAAGQASILGLYDQQRLRHPLKGGESTSWAEVDSDIRAQLDALRRQRRAVRFLSGTVASPTTRDAIARFLAGFLPNARHVVHDPFSCSAIREAHGRTHGSRVLPRFHIERAEVIVAFAADFLGTWISPVAFASAYRAGRYLQGPAPHLSYHVHFESRLSLTGSKADRRWCIAPGEMGLVLTHLAASVARKARERGSAGGRERGVNWREGDLSQPSVPLAFLDELAERLLTYQGRCLVLCGTQELSHQLICNYLNHLLGNYGTTLDISHPSFQNQSDDRALDELLQELRRGQVGALLVYRSNPLFDLPGGSDLRESLRQVPLLVSFSPRLDETAQHMSERGGAAGPAGYVCPEPHFLESWNDAEAVDGVVSIFQPALEALGNTRPLAETLAAWTGRPKPALDQIREYWQEKIYRRRLISGTFADFWEQAVHDGFVRVRPESSPAGRFNAGTVTPIRNASASPEGSYALVLYGKVGLLDGSHAYNPWLQELPDPLSKVTWDNYACLSPAVAATLNVRQGDVVRVDAAAGDGLSLELPVVIQLGQHDQVVAVALGYGSRLSDRFAEIGPPWLEARPAVGAIGVNASGWLTWRDGALHYLREGVRLTKTGQHQALACTQEQQPIRVHLPLVPAGRQVQPIIRETTLPAFRDTAAGGDRPAQGEARRDLWPDDHPIEGPRWGMAIDLSACTGCSACVIACQVENNIPVVGRDEVRRHREMHWLRIDRYYSSGAGGGAREGEASALDVAFQPMLCQQCGNAPCEVVCPVLATVHSAEGLNQQVYNRCVGTRYCANNCPYKVRRFNWFDYAHDDQLQNLVLNPDVTVRSRGVMEKCTFCVQRIQDAKIEARRLGRPLADGDIQTACQQSCPTRAIVFGNLNDSRSRASELAGSSRAYRVLEELNVQPAVSYLSVVRNR